MRLIPKDPTRRVLLGLFLAFIIPALISIWTVFSDMATPREMTATRMFVVKRRIFEYAGAHGVLPPNLAALPPLSEDLDASTVDAWGRPLDYSFDSAGMVTLESLGADKMPGGEGENRDMIGVFPTHDARGNWLGIDTGWTRDPER
jgi:hypothetical protein